MKTEIRILMTALSLFATLSIQAHVKSYFASAPKSVIPLIDNTARLDMIDYYEAGMDVKSDNRLLGKSVITAMTPESMTVSLNDASTLQIVELPSQKGDTLIAVITTVATPMSDSTIDFYTTGWDKLDRQALFAEPLLADWMADKKRQGDVESLVPFMLVSYEIEPADGYRLRLTNNLKGFLSEDVYSTIEPWLLPELTYEWKGGKYVKRK